VAAQLVQQRLHLVRQLGHVGKAEGGGAALDGVGAAEDGVELLVVGGVDVELQQHAAPCSQVLAGFLEEDLVELAEVDAGAGRLLPSLVISAMAGSLSTWGNRVGRRPA
jgi:acyl transferase domain-containing protein